MKETIGDLGEKKFRNMCRNKRIIYRQIAQLLLIYEVFTQPITVKVRLSDTLGELGVPIDRFCR
jgi:hypothetical protein